MMLLLLFRRIVCGWLVFSVILTVATWEILWKKMDGDRWYYYMYFFTNWTGLCTTLYFGLVSQVVSTEYLPISSKAAGLVWHVATTASLISTVVFWSVIFVRRRHWDRADGRNWLCRFTMAQFHGGTLGLLLVDMIWSCNTSLGVLGAYELKESLFTFVAFVAVYQCWVICIRAFAGFWVYSFMNPYSLFPCAMLYTVVSVCCLAVQKGVSYVEAGGTHLLP